jgi:diguanylate cyclase (GGDEF)-like protein
MYGGEPLAMISYVLDKDQPIPEVFEGFCEQLEEVIAGMVLHERDRQHLERLSYYDELTGLANRRLFGDRLRQAIDLSRRGGRSLALLYIDLDRFKSINDSMGHACGDVVLQTAGTRLRGVLRGSDVAARLGGDEFAVMLPDADFQRAMSVAEKLRKVLLRPCRIQGRDFVVDGSIGIAMFPRDGDDPETLLRHADTAMYQAKSTGLHVHGFVQGLAREAERQLHLEQALTRACDRARPGENDPFELYYQAKFLIDQDVHATEPGGLLGVEALLRWEQGLPGSEPVSPAVFIPLAEEIGLIRPLTNWALSRAALQAQMWQAQGVRPPRIGINISPVKLVRSGWARDLLDQFREWGVPTEWFEVEVTETAVMRNPEVAIASMRLLADAGISVAIDDFGTGYSSLAYLKQFPAEWLKIDIAFVRDLPHEGESVTIVRSVIAMAHALGVRVIAEGVETPEQLAFLREEGCDAVQGYLFCRPQPPEQMAAFLTAC